MLLKSYSKGGYELVKKIISLLLSALMTFSFVAVNANNAYAEGVSNKNTETYSQSEIAYYDRSADFLASVGVINNINEFNTSVSRGEFAYTLLALMGYDDPTQVQNEIQKFNDSDAKATDNGIINTVTDYGLLSFFDNGTFSKDEALTYDDAVKGLVCVLGYRFLAEENGGSINDYVSVANKIKLLKSVDAELGYAVSANNYIKLIMNALEVDMMVKKVGVENEYFIDKGNTILYNILNLIEGEGVVSANEYTDFNGGDGLSDGKIMIDNTIYDYNGAYTDMLGYHVEFYKDAKTNEIIYVTTVDNDEKTINGGDIISYSGRTYTYYGEDGKKKYDEEVTGSCKVVYNGKVLRDNYAFPIDMYTENSNLRFVDNNTDGVWDVLFIEVFDICIVDYNDTLNKIITDKYSTNNNINYSTFEVVEAIKSSGSVGDATSIKVGNVLSVLKSADGKLIKMYISTDTASGEVASLQKNSDGTVDVDVNGNTYKTRGSNEDINNITVGQSYMFYLDRDGRIVSCKQQLSLDTAFMIDAAKTGVIDEVVKLKVYDSTNAMKVLECAPRVTYNEVEYTNHATMYAALLNGETEIKSQPITYELNSEGKITSFNTAQADSEKIRFLHDVAYKDASNNVVKYRTGAKCFTDAKSYLKSNTIVYMVPIESEVKTADSDKFYALDIKTAFKNDENYSYSSATRRGLSLYQVGTTKIGADIAVCDSYYKSTNGSIGILFDKVTLVDENGDECVKLTVNFSSATYEFYARDTLLEKAKTLVDIGDVVTVSYYVDGASRRILTNLGSYYDISSGSYNQNNPNNNNLTASSRFYMADVYDIDGELMSMVMNGGNPNWGSGTATSIGPNVDETAPNFIYVNMSSAKVFKYDTSGREPIVETSSMAGIAPYTSVKDASKCSRVFILVNSEAAGLVYIVK